MNQPSIYERVMQGLTPSVATQLEAVSGGTEQGSYAEILQRRLANIPADAPRHVLQGVREGIEAALGDWGIEGPWWQSTAGATTRPRALPTDPGRGSMDYMLQQIGAGGPQAQVSQMTSMEDVMFMGMGWGFSRQQIEGQLAQRPGGPGAPSVMGKWLQDYYAAEYGGLPPAAAGQEGLRYPAYAWQQMPGARQARARREMEGYRPGMEYPVEEWEYPYVRRQGQAVPWSVEAVTGTWPGIPGEEPGTYMTGRPAGEAGALKAAKDIQRAGVYPQIELRRGEESLMQESAFRMGPLSGRRERGFQAPMVLIGQEWLPEGMMMLPEDYYTTGAFRFSKDIFLPKGFKPEMVEEGTTWRRGAVIPFTGAQPVDLGLGRSWSEATLHSHSIAEGRKWSAKEQEWQEGQFLRMGFDVRATPEMLNLSSKTFGAKYMAPMGAAERIHGIPGHGVSEIKDMTMAPVMWYTFKPTEAAAALSEIRGRKITPEQLQRMEWSDVGRELTQYFSENVLPQIYREKPLEFDVHREMIPQLPKGRFEATDIPGHPEMAHITTESVPQLVGEWGMMGRRGWSVKKPNIPFREMQMIKDVAGSRAADVVYDIEQQAAPTREAYSGLISANLASTSEGYRWPGALKQPTQIDQAAARGVVGRAYLAFEQRYEGKLPTEMPEGVSIMNRMILKEATSTWGTAISLGDTGVLASPDTAEFFNAPGIMAGSAVTGYVTSYVGAIKAAAEGTPEEKEEAYAKAVSTQSNLAESRLMLRQAMKYNVPRAIGEVVSPEMALGAGEISMPEARVLRAYGVSKKRREGFLEKWKAGEIEPTALVWGHPTTGREMFSRQVAIVHPDVLKERGAMLGEETPYRVSPMLAEMMGRDFDEDQLWALMTGHLTGSGQTLDIDSPSIPMATAEWVRSQAETVKSLGRGSLTPGGGLKKPPKMADEEWEELSGLERFQAALDPKYLREVGAKEQFEAQRQLAERQKAIGIRYNLMEDIVDTALERGVVQAGEHLHLAVHGRGQTPALLTPQLEKMMNYIESYTAAGGLKRKFAADPETRQGFAGHRGPAQLTRGLLFSGLGAVAEGAITPEIFGALFYPELTGEEREAGALSGIEIARKWRKAVGGSGLASGLATEISQIDPERFIRETVVGTVAGAHMLKRARARQEREPEKPYPTRLTAETEEFLDPYIERFAQIRTYRSKMGDEPLSARVEAATKLFPGERGWLGGYQTGTRSARAGRALVGEEGPEVVDDEPALSREDLARLYRESEYYNPEEEKHGSLYDLEWEETRDSMVPDVFDSYQTGTRSARAGRALVGEKGPEVVDLPEGAVVHPASSTESQDAITDRALATGQTQRFQEGGTTGPSSEIENFFPPGPEETLPEPGFEEGWWESIPEITYETPGRRTGPTAERQTYWEVQKIGGEPQEEKPWRPSYPPKVSAERFERSLDLYEKNIDTWAEELGKAGGITADFNEGMTALTGLVLGWKKDIEKGAEYSWQGAEMQAQVTRAEFMMEMPGGGAGPWQALGGIETAQQQAAFEQLAGMAGDRGGRGNLLYRPPTREGGWPGGAMGQAAQGLHRTFSGWELMRLQRMWGLTGGPVFQQMIPAAAQAEMAGWQAGAQIGGPGGMPGGVAGGVMEWQAAQSQSMIEAGRTGYRAWGGAMPAMGGLRQAQAIAGPAIGAGLVGGSIASTAAMTLGGMGAGVAATTVGLPVTAALAGIGLAYGGAEYMRSWGEPTAENQMALLGAEPDSWEMQRATMGRWMEQVAEARPPGGGYPGMGGRPGALQPSWEETRQWTPEQQRLAEQRAGTPLTQQTAQGRASTLNWMAQELIGQEGTMWAGLPGGETQAMQVLGQFAAYDPRFRTEAPEELIQEGGPPEWQWAMQTGIGPQQYQPLAQQMRLGSGGGWQLYQQTGMLPAWQQQQAMARYGQHAGMVAQGLVTPQQVIGGGEQVTGWEAGQLGIAQGPGLPELTGQAAVQYEQLQQANVYRISQMAAAGQAPAWMQRVQEGGLATGTTAFGGAWQAGAQQLVGMQQGLQMPQMPRALTTEGGGTVQISTGTVEIEAGGQWGLQDWQQAEQRGYQQWGLDFRRGGAAMQYAYTTGRAPEGYDMPAGGQQFLGRGMWDIQEEQVAAQHGYQMQQFGYQREQLDLQGSQFMERWGLGRQQMDVQAGWGMEDLQRRHQRQQVQFGWAGEDLAFRGATTTLQMGWQMEDYGEALRYSTGRERRQIMKQRERAVVSYGMQMGQLETQEGRLEQRKEWSDEDFQRDKQRHGQRTQWSRQSQDLSLRHHRQNMDLARRRQQTGEQYYHTQHQLQEESREKNHAFYEAQFVRQTQAFEMEQEHMGVLIEIQEIQKNTDRIEQARMARWGEFVGTNGQMALALSWLQQMGAELLSWSLPGGTLFQGDVGDDINDPELWK